jgi:predicted dehydrogenase
VSDNLIERRTFFGRMAAAGTLGSVAAAGLTGAAQAAEAPKQWQPISDRKVRVGIVGHGYCKFGASFGFQDHPNVEVVAVSDLIPQRRSALMKACRCEKSYPSLEELVKDDTIEAVFTATDAPSHARHSTLVLEHGKHAASAVPATFGSIEEGERLLEAVQTTGKKYMMFETSCFRADCYAMRTAYQAGAFGKLLLSEGEYHHYHASKEPTPSYKGWRRGLPPMWYPTHATAYYVNVTGERLTHVSCIGTEGHLPYHQPDANPYKNPFSTETALFETSEGASSRMSVSWSMKSIYGESGRVFGQSGCMSGTKYQGLARNLPDLSRPPLPPGVSTGGHGGSHGLVMQEFITAIIQDRDPLMDVYESLAMTVPGIVAHQSVLRDGERLAVPQYRRKSG